MLRFMITDLLKPFPDPRLVDWREILGTEPCETVFVECISELLEEGHVLKDLCVGIV